MATFKDLSRRKARLFAAACCRRIWGLLPDERCRRAVETAEAFADGQANVKALQGAHSEAHAAAAAVAGRIPEAAAWATIWATGPGSSIGTLALTAAGSAARAVAWATAKRFRLDAKAREQDAQQRLFHDMLPHPLAAIDPEWRLRNDGAVVKLAGTVYEERAMPQGTFDLASLGLLADVLEEAGCTDKAVLSHCREQGKVHVRGCWLVDLLLNKA